MLVRSIYGNLYGFLIKKTKTEGLFFQTDKNNQVCDIFTSIKGEGITNRVRGRIFDTFKGRPYSRNLISSIYDFINEEKTIEEEKCK